MTRLPQHPNIRHHALSKTTSDRSRVITPRVGPSIPVLVVFCGLMMGLSGYSTDVMLPAFDAMVVDLNTSLDVVQGTVSSFALFFGIGQFMYGPASDKYGRRPILSVGMTIFILGTILTTMGADIETVLVGRGLQGFGAGAAPVLARAILKDTHAGTALARAMAASMAIFAIGPILAPLIGYAVNLSVGWRGVFVSTGVFAASLLIFNLAKYRETNAHLNPDALKPKGLWKAVKTIITHRQSSYFLACGCAAYCALFTYISNAPRIYAAAFDVRGLGFAVLFAATGLGIVLGQVVNRALLPKLGILAVLRLASTNLFAASLGIAVLNWMDMLTAWSFTGLMFFFNTSFLVVISNTATLCLDPHPKLAGLASAFYGCVTNTTGALFITTTVAFVGISISQWSSAMVVLTAATAAGIWLVPPTWLSFNKD